MRRSMFAVSLCGTLLCACSKPTTASPPPERSAVAEAPATRASSDAKDAATPENAAALSTPTAPIATPGLAGADPCRVGRSVRLYTADKGKDKAAIGDSISLEVGYGMASGLAAWQVEPGKLHTQRLDLAGNPSGPPGSFKAPRTAFIRWVRPLSDGFVIGADDSSENPPRWFVWLTNAAGNIVDQQDLDLGPHIIDALSPVVADRMLLFLSNRRSTNQETSRVLLLTLSGGRARQQSFDFPVASPSYPRASLELALGASDWSVWRKERDEPALLLGPRGYRAPPPLRVPRTLFSRFHTVNLRYLGDTLQVLTAVEESSEPAATTTLRIDTLERDGNIQSGKPFAFTPAVELPAPFANELNLSFDSKTAKRETFIGPHPIGAPISLASVSPPITDPLTQASAAWSSTHWVIAYWNQTAKGGSVNVFGIRCGP